MLPDKYKFLETVGTLPKMVNAALQFLGVKEIAGSKSNPVILNMAKELGIGDIYTNDDMSWCALFINYLIKITGKPIVPIEGDEYNLLRAKWLQHWGVAVPNGEEQLGDILIFDREGGGHVGLYIGESGSTYHVCGGNQNNCVSFVEIAKNRLLGARRYYAMAAPESAQKYLIGGSGLTSQNES